MNKTDKIFAFTLAEVLITLGIIGVVAAMTLPSLVQKYQEKVTVTKVKKFYSVISQAYLLSIKDYGTPDQWGFGGRDAAAETGKEDVYIANNAKIMKDKLFSHIKKLKDCDGAINREACGLAKDIYMANGWRESAISDQSAAVGTIDGSSVAVVINTGSCTDRRGYGKYLENTCGWIDIDINGIKPPNTLGKDIFGFYLTKYGIIPAGTANETSHTFSETANTGTCKNYGLGCTAWVIFNENLDYLHCNDLSWNGKKKCK